MAQTGSWTGGESRFSCCNAQMKKDYDMTKFLTLMDRAALGLINALVVIGLPLVAIGMVAGAV